VPTASAESDAIAEVPMDMQSFKALELLLIVGVVGWFYLRQKRSLDQLRQEREAKREQEGDDGAGGAG
jgi:hypothetical protein